jgi:hypothetical protein
MIEAFVENRVIGFIREGQSAEVKIDAGPFTRDRAATNAERIRFGERNPRSGHGFHAYRDLHEPAAVLGVRLARDGKIRPGLDSLVAVLGETQMSEVSDASNTSSAPAATGVGAISWPVAAGHGSRVLQPTAARLMTES